MNTRTLFFFFISSFLSSIGGAQEVSVFFQKDLHFGEFYLDGSSGGILCISNSGRISPSSNIRLLNSEYQPATLLVSTSSEEYVDFQIEVFTGRLKNREGGNLRFRINKPDKTYYRIKRGMPVEINLGGCLDLEPGEISSSAEHLGKIQVNVILLNK